MDKSVNKGGNGATVMLMRSELFILMRSPSIAAIDLADVPTLVDATRSTSIDDLLACITKAALDMPESKGVAVLLLFENTTDRWNSTLKSRGDKAGTALGVGSYHTMRDRKRRGRSYFDDLLDEIAEGLVVSSTNVDTSKERLDPLPNPSGTKWLGVAAILACLGVGTLIWIGMSSGSHGGSANETDAPISSLPDLSIAPPVDGCDIPVGAVLNPSQVSETVVLAFVQGFIESGGVERVGCPAHTASSWNGVWIQELRDGVHLIVGPDTESGFVVSRAIIEEYRSVAGGNIVGLGGAPVRVGTIGGFEAMYLSEGGAVVGHSSQGPAYWLPAPAMTAWIDAGGPDGVLGLPLTDINYVTGVLTQHFEGGLMTAPNGEAEPPLVEVVERRPVDIETGILRSFDGTAWWIDGGARHWIADGGVWECLGGEDAVIENEAPGWRIGAYESGKLAVC